MPKEREGPKVTRKEERKGGKEGGVYYVFLSLYALILPMNDVAIYWRRVTKAEERILILGPLYGEGMYTYRVLCAFH
jgi:hypothetical protein